MIARPVPNYIIFICPRVAFNAFYACYKPIFWTTPKSDRKPQYLFRILTLFAGFISSECGDELFYVEECPTKVIVICSSCQHRGEGPELQVAIEAWDELPDDHPISKKFAGKNTEDTPAKC